MNQEKIKVLSSPALRTRYYFYLIPLPHMYSITSEEQPQFFFIMDSSRKTTATFRQLPKKGTFC